MGFRSRRSALLRPPSPSASVAAASEMYTSLGHVMRLLLCFTSYRTASPARTHACNTCSAGPAQAATLCTHPTAPQRRAAEARWLGQGAEAAPAGGPAGTWPLPRPRSSASCSLTRASGCASANSFLAASSLLLRGARWSHCGSGLLRSTVSWCSARMDGCSTWPTSSMQKEPCSRSVKTAVQCLVASVKGRKAPLMRSSALRLMQTRARAMPNASGKSWPCACKLARSHQGRACTAATRCWHTILLHHQRHTRTVPHPRR